jgi:hypothetical protein
MSTSNQIPKARQLRLNIRMSRPEWDKVHTLATNTTCRSVSEYARKVLAEKPVKVFYRNKSFDDFEEQMTRLLPQLEAFGDNFSLLVKKITSIESIPEIRSALPLILACEKDFAGKMETIKDQIENLSNQCAQKS